MPMLVVTTLSARAGTVSLTRVPRVGDWDVGRLLTPLLVVVLLLKPTTLSVELEGGFSAGDDVLCDNRELILELSAFYGQGGYQDLPFFFFTRRIITQNKMDSSAGVRGKSAAIS